MLAKARRAAKPAVFFGTIRTARAPWRRSRIGAAGSILATSRELDQFLAGVERRAFKQAQFAVRDQHAALDIVQDAMLKLAAKYGRARPADELPMLFQRILQNTIRDYYRRQKVRSLWTTLVSSLLPKGSEDDRDPLDGLAVPDGADVAQGPAEAAESGQTLAAIDEAVAQLPPRQREAFLLRYWHDLDVRETAEAMGCSEGSVKTHCSRATHALAEALRARGIEP